MTFQNGSFTPMAVGSFVFPSERGKTAKPLYMGHKPLCKWSLKKSIYPFLTVRLMFVHCFASHFVNKVLKMLFIGNILNLKLNFVLQLIPLIKRNEQNDERFSAIKTFVSCQPLSKGTQC